MHTTSYHRPGLLIHEHILTVPLDHATPNGETIELFARELVPANRQHDRLPYLLWLQGGPGGQADRPGPISGWLARALREFRVILLDQRGTGRSTPATRQTVPTRGNATAQAEYLAHFRADAIVHDAEHLRRQLSNGNDKEIRWTLLGQSYGGFCVLAYLSLAPEGIQEALIAGGLPALRGGPDQVYRATYPLVAALSEKYFTRYPDDRSQASEIVRHLANEEERLPTGEVLTPRRFQTAGNELGNRVKFDGLHALLEAPFVTVNGTRRLSDAFLHGLSGPVSFATRPLYAVLHEPIYCQGEAARWSAHRIRGEQGGRFEPDADPFIFTGEMVYPWQFDEDPALVPLREAAELLAAKDDWPAIYDPDRLAANTVPVAAAIYVDDLYVPYELSIATARQIRSLRPWITNEYHHDGIREDGGRVLDRLLALARE